MAGVNHTREKGPSHRKTFPGGVPSTYSGPTAARPGAGEVDPGTLYLDTDTNDISRSDGHSWDGGFGGGSTALNDLTDVTIAAVATGDYLRKSAGDWVNVTVSQLLTDIKTVDGTGSGLDADLLDGQSSAYFLDRANHTGTQLAATISDFTEAAQDAVGAMAANSARVTLTYVDATPSLTADLVADSVTVGYLHATTNNVLFGRTTAGAGAGEEITLDTDATLAANSDTRIASQKALKTYIDNAIQGLEIKKPARLATAAAIAAYTYANGTLGVGATITFNAVGSQSVDGTATALNDRILVKDETGGNAPYNGVYYVSTKGTGGVAEVWTRTTDNDQAADFPGSFVFVEEGTVNADSGWVCTTDAVVVVGTTNIAWSQFSGAGQITAGAALTKTGNQLDVAVDGSTIEVSADALRVKDAGITYAKIQNISATQRVLGRNSAGAGSTEEVTASQVLDWRTTTRGSLLYRGASTWDGLAPGTSGYPLLSSGAGADPAYGQADHGAALTGLGDDDHTQYLLLAGRAGGQVAKGGTAASEVLDLYGTAHATLGAVRVKDHLGFTLISPSQITSNQNNYAPGISTVLRLSSDASRDITGVVAPVPASCASIVCLINVGSNNIVLKNQDANSSAANRFLMEDGADLTLTADDFCWAVYDYTTTRWRVEKKGSGGGATNALLDGANHTDTVAQAVTRGSIIYGDSTPKWNELVLGTVGQVLMSDGTDLYYKLDREAQHVYLALATEVTNTAGSATTAANLLQNASSTDATSYATAAVTFSAAKLAIITIFSVVGSGTVNQATATQAGATPRTLDAIGYVTTGQIGMTMFRCMASTASSSGAVTFDFNGQTQLRASWIIDEITNADPAGNADNGASCLIHQTPVTNTGTGTTASVTMAAYEGDGAGAYAAFGNNENHAMTASNGYTGIGTATAEALAVIRGVFDGAAPAAAPSATMTSSTFVGIGVEIRRDPGWYTAAEHPWLYEADNFPTGMKAYPEGFMRTAGGATDQAVIQFYQLNATAAYVVESVLTGTQVTAGNFNSPLTNRARYTTGIAKASLTDGYTYCVRAGGLGDAQIGIKGLRHYIF